MRRAVLSAVILLAALPGPAAAPASDAVPALPDPFDFLEPRADGRVPLLLEFHAAPSPAAVAAARALDPDARVLRLVPALAVEVPRERLAEALALPGLAQAWPDRDVGPALDSAGASVGAPAARAAHGVDGAGVVLAFLDSGVDAAHPALDDLDDDPATDDPKVVAFHDLVNGRAEPYDDYGHGTLVASAAAGTAGGMPAPGLAPGARLVAVKVLDQYGRAPESRLIAGIEWVVENADALGVRVLSISLVTATNSDGRTPLERAVEAAAESGLLVTCAAGNGGGSSGTVRSPATSRGALAVGATDDAGAVASFSSRGPTVDGRPKPDLVAPGVALTVARAGGGTETASGTSLAAPVVAGVAALLLDAAPTLDREGLDALLRRTARDVGAPGPDNAAGDGRVDAAAALANATAAAQGVAVRLVRPPAWTPAGASADVVVRVANPSAANASTVLRVEAGAGQIALPLDLAPGERRDVAVAVPAPAADGDAVVGAALDALPGEASLDDNAAEAPLVVRTPARTLRVAVLDSPGTDFAWMFAWDLLADRWWRHGDAALVFDTTSLAHEGVTAAEIRALAPDVLLLPDLCCPDFGHELTPDEVAAVAETAFAGTAVVGTWRTLLANPALGPVFGVSVDFAGNYLNEFVAWVPGAPLGEGVPNPLYGGAPWIVYGFDLAGAEAQAFARTAGGPAALAYRGLPGATTYLAFPADVVAFGARSEGEHRAAYNALVVAEAGSAPPVRDLGLTRLRLTSWAAPGETVQGLVRVHNGGALDEAGELEACDALGACARFPFTAPAGGWTDVAFDVAFPDSGLASRRVEVRILGEDAWPANDALGQPVVLRARGALVVEDVDPWTVQNPAPALLRSAGFGVDVVTSADLAAAALARYAKVVVAGDQPGATWDAVLAHEPALAAYVEAGGVLEMHAVVRGGGARALPLGFALGAGPGGLLCDPRDPASEPACGDDVVPTAAWHAGFGAAEAALDGWGWTHRGALAAPERALVAVRSADGSALAVESPRGAGAVLATTLALERRAFLADVRPLDRLLRYVPAAHEALALEAVVPLAADAGAPFAVGAEVVNLATTNRSGDVVLLVDGAEAARVAVALAPGGRAAVALPTTLAVGVREVAVVAPDAGADWANRVAARVVAGRRAVDESFDAPPPAWATGAWTLQGGEALAPTARGTWPLEMPLLDLRAARGAVLEADVRFATEYGGAALRLEASVAGGPWTALAPQRGPQHPRFFEYGFNGQGEGTAAYDLGAYAGRTVRLRWVAALLADEPGATLAVERVVVRADGADPGFAIELASPPPGPGGLALAAEGPVELAAAVSGPVARVEFRVDGALVAVDEAPPFRATWAATPGAHDVRAVAVRAEGDVEASRTVVVRPAT